MLKMNPRGRVPVLKDDDYVVFESVAVLYYLDLKYPQQPIFGTTPEEGGVIMRVIWEFAAYAEPSLIKITEAVFGDRVADNIDELTDAMHVVGREARTIEGRLSKEEWIVGANYSATDMVIFSVDSTSAARDGTGRPRPSLGHAFCPWSAIIRRWRAGSAHRITARLRANLPAHWRDS